MVFILKFNYGSTTFKSGDSRLPPCSRYRPACVPRVVGAYPRRVAPGGQAAHAARTASCPLRYLRRLRPLRAGHAAPPAFAHSQVSVWPHLHAV